MRPVLSVEQMRAFDAQIIAAGVSGSILMENAGRGAAHLIGLKLRPRAIGQAPHTGSSVAGSCVRCADERSLAGAKVLVLAGSGNNGGDGFVVARHLAARGAAVSVLMTCPAERLSGDAQLAFLAMEAINVLGISLFEADFRAHIADADCIVDALLGTGAEREVTGVLREVIECVNSSAAYVVALDIPSGLHATTGVVLGAAVRAQHTVTFAHLKQGLLTTYGHEHAGNITLSHIGVPSALPAEIEPAAWLLEESDVRARLPVRAATSHKGTAGRVVVVAGSPGTIGAARLTSRAALRGGAGLVTICSDAEVISKLEEENAEVMTRPWASAGSAAPEEALFSAADALIVGPGLGQAEWAHAAIRSVLLAGRPTVVDADALRFIATTGRVFWREHQPGAWCVLTPHPAEAASLLGVSTAEVENDRFGAVKELTDNYGATVLLKVSRPLMCAPGRAPVVSAFGSPALATAGSGDVLCGILAAQLVGAPGISTIFDRLLVAVALQGQAAELWTQENGDRGLLASEIGDLVPRVMARWG